MKAPVIHTATDLIYPDPISLERVSFLMNIKGIAPEVAELDFELMKQKLQDPEEGMGWTP